MQGFLSYARNDNSAGKITALKNAIQQTLRQVTGNDDDTLYMDTHDVRWGDDWRQALDRALEDSKFFIAVLTPSYFKRVHCLTEFQKAVALGLHVCPLYYRRVELLERPRAKGYSPEARAVAREAARLERRDFRELRYESLSSGAVEKFLDSLAEEIERRT